MSQLSREDKVSMPYHHTDAIEDVLCEVEEGNQIGVNLPFLLVMLKQNPSGPVIQKCSAANAIRKLAALLPVRKMRMAVAFSEVLTPKQINRGKEVLLRLEKVRIEPESWPAVKANFYKCCRACADIEEVGSRERVGWLVVHETFSGLRDGIEFKKKEPDGSKYVQT